MNKFESIIRKENRLSSDLYRFCDRSKFETYY